MKKTLALFATVLAAVLNAATPSTSLVYVDTTARTLTGNIVAGNNTTISASGNGTITATAAPLTGITGLGTGVSTFLATPSSANLASAVTNETGSGALVFATSPTLVTPVIGAATGTSLSLTGAATSNNAFLVDTNTSFVSHTATAGKLQAQTSWGGVLSGFGTTNDVSIFNKSGGLALSVPTGTTNVGIAGTLLIPDGTTAAPSLTFAADTNTGIARAATDSLEITAGGTRSALFTSTGQTVSGNLTVSGTGTSTFGGTVRAGAGSGETLSAGSVDVTGDIGIKSTQGIVQGNARIVTFTSGNTSLAGNLTVSGSGGTTTSDVTLGTSGPSVKSSLGARAPRQGLVFDGTNGATSTAKFSAGSAHTLHGWLTPTTSDVYRAIFSNRTGGGSTNGVLISRGNTGIIAVYQANSTPDNVASTGTAPINKTTAVTIVFDGSSVKIYLNGTLDTSTNVSGYPTGLFDLELGVDGAGGVSKWIGGLSGALLYNRALSASEVLALYESGAPAGADYNSATNTALNTNTFENSNIYAYGTFSGASATGFTAVSNGTGFQAAYAAKSITFKTGTKYRLTYTLTLNSGAAPFFVLGNPGVAGYSAAVQLSAGANSVEVTATATGTSAQGFGFQHTSSAGNYSISNISLVPVGLLLAPDAHQVGGGSVWADTSGNAAHITLPASGVSWNVPSQIGEYVSASLASASATSLTNSTAKTVTSISLTAGDWDVDGFIGYIPSAATVSVLYGGASTTNNTLAGEATYFQTPTSYSGLSTAIQSVFPSQRVSITSTTTVYLIARADFSAGTMSAFGQIKARRVR